MDLIHLRVNMKHVEPKVMRSLLVPLDIRLKDLHITLQFAIGWTNSHLYSFETRHTMWMEPDDNLWDLPTMQTYWIVNITLREFLTIIKVKQFSYIYDFGDYWEHTIHVGAIRKAKAGELYPQLVRVKGRCPPEDIGGPWGYGEFLSIMEDKNHPEYDEYVEWYPGTYNVDDSQEDELRKHVEGVAKLISEGRLADEYFEYGFYDEI